YHESPLLAFLAGKATRVPNLRLGDGLEEGAMRVRKLLWRIWILSTVVSMVMAAGSLCFYLYTLPYYTTAATLPNEIQAAKQEGLPLTPADLMRAAPVPNDQNAARLYAQIPPIDTTQQDDNSLLAVSKGKATVADRQTAQRLLV